jgi:hypothetical protein
LPALQRIAGYLAGALDERENVEVRVDEPHRFDVVHQTSPNADGSSSAASVVRPTSVTGPDGKSRTIVQAQGDQPAEVAQTDLPGQYVVALSEGAPPTLKGTMDFAVNVDPSEGDLTRADPKELVAYFGEGTRTQTGLADDAQPKSHTPAWTGLLVLAVMVFFAEGSLLAKP